MALLARFVILCVFATFLPLIPAAFPQTPRPFFQGKTVFIDIGSAAGGAYDAYGRLIAAHIAQFIPGSPSVVVRNMPGAASMVTAQHLFNSSPKDGTEIGIVINTMPLTQLTRPETFPLKPQDFNWIGTVASPTEVLTVWNTAGIKTIEDAKEKTARIGGTTLGTNDDAFPRISNSLLGTKFAIVDGYEGGAAINLAMERGEVQGQGGNSWLSYQFQHPDWIQKGEIIPLFQVTFDRTPALPNVPTLLELAQNEEQKEIISMLTTAETLGNPMIAPPGVPEDRVAILRHALDEMCADPTFLADAKKANLEVSPVSGTRLQSLVSNLMESRPEIVRRFKQSIGQ